MKNKIECTMVVVAAGLLLWSCWFAGALEGRLEGFKAGMNYTATDTINVPVQQPCEDETELNQR